MADDRLLPTTSKPETDGGADIDFDEFADQSALTWDDGSLESDHRGAFGEFGGAETGFLDRAFRERIVLVGVTTTDRTEAETDASLDELALLVDTAGADALERIVQKRDRPDPATSSGGARFRKSLSHPRPSMPTLLSLMMS